MNVHHLELFYYVAKHGGISAAVRHIPYGIQQPAVSGQMGKLEEDVGVKLFERNPFRLTGAGQRLFEHVQPFFENLDAVGAELRQGEEPELRIGSSELLLREHVPAVINRLRAEHPRVRLGLRAGHQTELEGWLLEGQIDVAICPVEARPPPRLRAVEIARVPMVLLVEKRSPWRTAEDLWTAKKITEPLVGLPAATGLMRSFQRELKRRGIVWPQRVETASMELVTSYAANGHGIGVSLADASVSKRPKLRVLPLDGFEPITMGVMTRATPSALLVALIEEARRYAADVWSEWVVKAGPDV